MSKKSGKKVLLLLFGITLIFFISPVSAQIVNGDFETGTTAGWNETGYHSSINSGHQYNGSYCGWMGGYYYGTPTWSGLQQNVDLSYYNELSVFFKMVNLDPITYQFFIDDNEVTTFSVNTTYNEKVIDISSYYGFHEIEFRVTAFGSYWSFFYIDDVILQDYVVPSNSINYDPNIPVSNVKPFNLFYTLNSTYEGQYCEIYSYSGIDIGNETHPNIIWHRGFEGYVNQPYGSFITSDYFHNTCWPDLNETYGIGLFNPGGAHPGIRFPDIETDPNFLAKDQIYVHYNYSYPTPTPQPTPNATPTATPTGTPTPGPTATAQPDPEPNNESLNTSFTEGYYGFVNDTVDGFFVPVYNFTDYIAQPLTMLNQTLDNFTVEMNKSFNNASGSLGISTSILFLIMVGFPQKLINVMTYYLAWVIILLIFKGDT